MKRRRIALLIPHSDTTLEEDLQRSLSGGWVFHTSRMWLDGVGEYEEKKMLDAAFPEAARMLCGVARYDRAIFGCTSASAVYGKEGLERLEKRMGAMFGCPAVSAFGAVLREIGKRKAKRIALITPYTAEVNRFVAASLNEFGVETSFCEGLGLSNDSAIARVEPEELFSFAASRAERIRAGGDLLLLSCTNLRAMEIREALEDELGLDVLTSNQSICNWIESV